MEINELRRLAATAREAAGALANQRLADAPREPLIVEVRRQLTVIDRVDQTPGMAYWFGQLEYVLDCIQFKSPVDSAAPAAEIASRLFEFAVGMEKESGWTLRQREGLSPKTRWLVAELQRRGEMSIDECDHAWKEGGSPRAMRSQPLPTARKDRVKTTVNRARQEIRAIDKEHPLPKLVGETIVWDRQGPRGDE